MTKQQIIDALTSKYTKVASEIEWQTIKTILGIDLIAIPIWEKLGEAMWENNILICKDGDNYYWKNGEPKSTLGLFGIRVQSFIDSKIIDGTVKFAIIKDINQANKKATISAIMPDKTTKIVLLTETSENIFNIEVIS
jgi:hypothetical protein